MFGNETQTAAKRQPADSGRLETGGEVQARK
jgi:hypothetical protein